LASQRERFCTGFTIIRRGGGGLTPIFFATTRNAQREIGGGAGFAVMALAPGGVDAGAAGNASWRRQVLLARVLRRRELHQQQGPEAGVASSDQGLREAL